MLVFILVLTELIVVVTDVVILALAHLSSIFDIKG